MTPAEREFAIEKARKKMVKTRDPEERRFWWHVMRQLIAGRSPETVREMEEARGLR